MIWTYNHSESESIDTLLSSDFPNYDNPFKPRYEPSCIYCGNKMQFMAPPQYRNDAMRLNSRDSLEICPSCGWWKVCCCWETWHGEYDPARHYNVISGSLINMDSIDLSAPIIEVKAYLTAKYDDIIKIHPRKMELLVADVFRNSGLEVRTTAYSGDDGIDLIVFDSLDNKMTGIQVKRYKNKIEAEQIRSFAGALLLNNMTQGIFITTGQYSKGAGFTAAKYEAKGIKIDLWDSNRFYDALRIVQRPMYNGSDDVTAPFFTICMDYEIVRRKYRERCKAMYGQEMG